MNAIISLGEHFLVHVKLLIKSQELTLTTIIVSNLPNAQPTFFDTAGTLWEIVVSPLLKGNRVRPEKEYMFCGRSQFLGKVV